jgi:hypothetical protein
MFYNQLIPRLRQEVGQTAVLKLKRRSSSNSIHGSGKAYEITIAHIMQAVKILFDMASTASLQKWLSETYEDSKSGAMIHEWCV